VSAMSSPVSIRRKRPDFVALGLGAYVSAFFFFLLAPIVVVVVASFSSSSFIAFPIPGWTLQWYYRIFEYPPFIDSLITSLQLAVLSALVGALLGIPAALWVARSTTKAADYVTNLLLAPLAVPAIVLGLSLLYFLSVFGIGISFIALLIAHSVVAIPYVARTVIAVYRSISPNLEAAGAILGANRWQILRYITVPLVKPGIFAGCIFSMLISLDNLALSFFFGTARVNTLPVVVLSYIQYQFDPSIAAICAVQMLIAVVTLLILDRLVPIEQLTAV
jgi:putative spermidine/putrescine transport system permease protein